MEKLNLTTETRTFSDIMGNGRYYTIPLFQRDYSWGPDEWRELWQDCLDMIQENSQHFMGYLVLEDGPESNRQFSIIDGQQRLTTITLIILAAIANLQKLKPDHAAESEKNKLRIEIYQNYIGRRNEQTLEKQFKLSLNRNNREHFENMLETTTVGAQRNITETNRLINKAFVFFDKQFASYSGEKIQKTLNHILDGLVFSTMTLSNKDNAYALFESLNARGVHLSASDLFKNYLLSVLEKDEKIYPDYFAELDSRWASILAQLGETAFTDFLRSHTGMTQPLPPKKTLYKTLKKIVPSSQYVDAYIKSIETTAPIYAALQHPHDSLWIDNPNRKPIETGLHMLNLFNIKTPLSLLMAATQHSDPTVFTTILRWITIISLRAVITGQNTKDQEVVYNKTARALTSGAPLSDCKTMLRSIYINDDRFYAAFKEYSIVTSRTSKKAIYLLRSIENHLSPDNKIDETITIEHVLPRHPCDEWQVAYGRLDYNHAIDRLGNLTLATASTNTALSTHLFQEKRQLLAQSPYKLSQTIANYTTWDHATLTKHQAWLAKQAKSVWNLPEFALT
jgi:hypothetical protein